MKKIILALFILYLPFQLVLPQIPVINTINFFLILLLFIFIFGRNPDVVKPQFEIPLLLFLTIWTISFLHTILFPRGIWTWEIAKEFKRLITLVLGYFVFARCLKNKEDVQFLFYIFLLSLALVGLHTWRNGMLAGIHFADFKRSSGPFAIGWQGADIAGGFLAMLTPFLLSFSLLTKKRLPKLLGFGGFVICIMGLLATYSRGSIFALGIACIVSILVITKLSLKQSKSYAIIVVVILIAGAIGWRFWVPETIINRMQGTVIETDSMQQSGIDSLDESSQKRVDIWKAGLELFWQNPIIGVGFKRPQYELGVDTHNTFILIAAEMGILGILVFLWFLWKILREAILLLNTEFIILGVGFIGCITAFVFVNIFYSNFFRDTVVGSFWVILGILAGCKNYIGGLKNRDAND